MQNNRKKQKKLKAQVRERTMSYIVAAFGLVAGLAWNDAIRALIDHLFPLQRNTLVAKFAYAVLITIVVVILTVYLVRLFQRSEEE